MIDARTGRVEPCPNCGSRDVRWRGRRWYDFVLTYARFSVEAMLRVVGFGRMGPSTPGGAAAENANGYCEQAVPLVTTGSMIDDVNSEIHYEQLREYYEVNAGTAVARRYWKCRACKQRGQVFDHVERLLAPRARVAELEDGIARRPGGVSYPVDRDGIGRR